jgi:hypothetical protein
MAQAALNRDTAPPVLALVAAAPPSAPSQVQASESKVAGKYPWIVNPAIDLLFCCGGIVWILFAVHWLFLGPNGGSGTALGQMLAICTIAGTHALGETHIAATLARVYKTPQSAAKFKPYTSWVAYACIGLAVAGLFVQGITPILAKIYLIWVAQHFTAQTYGLTLMYLYKGNYQVGWLQKHLLKLLMTATAAFAILRQFTYKEWNPDGFLAQHIPFWGPLPESIIHVCNYVLVFSAIGFGLCVLKKLVMERQMIPFPALLMVATGVLIFVLGKDITGVFFLYAPAFYHGSQYVVLSIAYYLKESGLTDTVPRANFGKLLLQSPGVRYQGLLLLLAATIYIGVPRLLSEFGFSYTLSFATIFVAVNLHHFITDQAIWKLRDPEVRRNMLA